MWICPDCNRKNDPGFDLCGKCGSSRDGQHDPFIYALCRWRSRFVRMLFLLPVLYVASYFLLGSHRTGIDFKWSGRTSKQYTYHDRAFPFDPWIYQPVARIEYWVRGQRSQVVVEENYRGGQPIYAFGPFE